MKNETYQRGGAFALVELMIVIAIIGLLSAIAIPKAYAGLQNQVDTNTLFAVTNTFKLSGDVSGSFTNGQTFATPVIDGSKSTALLCSVGGYFTNCGANANNIDFRIAGTVDGSIWTNSAALIRVIVPGNTTNWCETIFVLTPSLPLYGLRAVESTNGGAPLPNKTFFKAFSKTGI